MEYISLITFLLGLLIGNRLAIGRDRRKEFNEFTYPLYRKIISFLDGNSHVELPEIETLERVVDYLPYRKTRSYNSHIHRLKTEMEMEREFVAFDYDKQKTVIKPGYIPKKDEILNDLLPYLRRH